MRIVLLAFVALLQATQPATAPVELESMQFEGVKFAYPRGWVVRELPLLGGLMIISPTAEADYQPNLFFEIRETPPRITDEILRDTKAELAERKRKLADTRSSLHQHPGGFEYIDVRYECEDITGLKLAERQVIVPMTENTRLIVQMSCAAGTRETCDPLFDRITESIRLNR